MPIPLLVWGGIALLGALAGGGIVLATSDAAEEIGEAVEQSANSLSKLLMTTAIVGGVVFFEAKTGLISDGLKKVFK